MLDPRLEQQDNSELEELYAELEKAQVEALASEKILNDQNITQLFENIIKKAFYQFTMLPENATLEQYRGLHLRAKSVQNLREILKAKLEIRDKILEHIREQEKGELT